MIKHLNEYCQDILSGRIKSGIHIRNAVSRFQSDLEKAEENGFYFDESKVNNVINFIAELRHFTGKHAGKPFILQPWQVFIISNLYGFYNKDGTRRFQTAYLEMARKQGKTALVAALTLYHLIADGEEGGEILLTANSLDQANICFRMVSGYAFSWDPDKKVIKHRYKDLHYPENNSFIRVLASDSNKLDGYNCSFGVVDEYHSAPTAQTRDVLRSSMGMRENPMLVTITTAGFDKSLPCYDLRTIATEISAGVKQDNSFFAVVYSLDDKDDWKDESNWVKSNPNLDVTVTTTFLQKQVQQAINNPLDEVGVKTKNLNMWCDSSQIWIPDEYVVQATKKIEFDEFSGEDCFIGVDLASNVDLTAVTYLVVKDNKYYFKSDYYIPADTLKVRNLHADKDLYTNWVRTGYLKVTAGNVTDYNYITEDILKVANICDVKDIYYDKYNATEWAIKCTEEGLNMTPFSQTIGNFNNCTRSFERLMLGGQVYIDDNPITRYCLRNVELRRDLNGNVKPSRLSESKKIDGVISALQALAAQIEDSSNYKGTNIF